MPEISIVIPVYNEEENVELLCRTVHEAVSPIGRSYEVILVDDGSTDNTWPLLVEQAGRYPCFELIRFRRNFGQTAAMSAGFEKAAGEIVITLDADLQNDPNDIPKLLEEMTEGVDVVSGWRRDRKDPFINRRLPSMIANGLISRITGVFLHDYGCTLKAYRREVIKNVHLYGEMHRFIPALASWVGRGLKEVVVNHRARQFGESKYGISRTFRVVLDLITVKFLLRYRMGPMQMFGKIAAWFFGPGLFLLFLIMLENILYWTSGFTFGEELLIKRPFWIMTSFMMLFMGMQFISMGLLAEIQIRTYHESQDKPTYVIGETFSSASKKDDSASAS